jgi:hypothetical protein
LNYIAFALPGPKPFDIKMLKEKIEIIMMAGHPLMTTRSRVSDEDK